MKQLWNRFKLWVARLTGKFFASKLPIGATDFDNFTHSILTTYEIPDLPSYHHAVASMILHLGPQTNSVKKYWVARSIHKAQVNETAFHVIQKIKEDEKKKASEPAQIQSV